MNKKKTIIITSIVIFIIFALSIVGCIVVYNQNKSLKEKKLQLVIYQYYTSGENKTLDPVVFTSFEFSKTTFYSQTIHMLEDPNEYNHVYVENGKVIVTQSNCYNGNCKRMIIDINDSNFSLLNPNLTTIECKPHGLKITLEEVK